MPLLIQGERTNYGRDYLDNLYLVTIMDIGNKLIKDSQVQGKV